MAVEILTADNDRPNCGLLIQLLKARQNQQTAHDEFVELASSLVVKCYRHISRGQAQACPQSAVSVAAGRCAAREILVAHLEASISFSLTLFARLKFFLARPPATGRALAVVSERSADEENRR